MGFAFVLYWVFVVVLLALEVPMFLTAILAAVITAIVFFFISWVLNVAEKNKKQKEKNTLISKLNAGTWKFPIDSLQESLDGWTIQAISMKDNYHHIEKLVQAILTDNDVPYTYYKKYASKDAISSYISIILEQKRSEAAEQRKSELQQLRNEEEKLKNETTKYAGCCGREKSIRYCQDQIAYYREVIALCERNEKSVRNGGEMLYQAGKQKESSWAIHGGIASGIAGGAAGLAVAADVERRNQEERQQNSQLAGSIAQLSSSALIKIGDEKSRAENSIKHLEEQKSKANSLRVEYIDPKVLLEQIQLKVISTENSPTGAVKLKIKVQSVGDVTIQENVRAAVDGSIRILLHANGKKVGEGLFSLGYGGARIGTRTYICTNVSEQATSYQVSFEPNHLWAVEWHG